MKKNLETRGLRRALKFTALRFSASLSLLFVCVFIAACAPKQPRWVAVEEIPMDEMNAPIGEKTSLQTNQATLQLASLKTASPVVATQANLPTRQVDELAPGFLLKIECQQDSAINGSYRVEADGNLKLAYGIQLNAAGMSIDQLQQELVSRYKEFFRAPPRISVKIEERKYWVEAQGLVTQPGPFLIAEGASLDQLITQAGGLQRAGDGKPSAHFVRITQANASRVIRLSDYYSGTDVNFPAWYGSDKVFFQAEGDPSNGPLAYNPEAIQILGQVRSPGEYSYRPNGDLFYYIGQAGGLTDRADLNNLMLVRTSGDKRLAYSFTMEQIQHLPQISRGDIIFVHADNLGSTAKTTRTLSEIGQFFGSVATSILLLIAL